MSGMYGPGQDAVVPFDQPRVPGIPPAPAERDAGLVLGGVLAFVRLLPLVVRPAAAQCIVAVA